MYEQAKLKIHNRHSHAEEDQDDDEEYEENDENEDYDDEDDEDEAHEEFVDGTNNKNHMKNNTNAITEEKVEEAEEATISTEKTTEADKITTIRTEQTKQTEQTEPTEQTEQAEQTEELGVKTNTVADKTIKADNTHNTMVSKEHSTGNSTNNQIRYVEYADEEEDDDEEDDDEEDDDEEDDDEECDDEENSEIAIDKMHEETFLNLLADENSTPEEIQIISFFVANFTIKFTDTYKQFVEEMGSQNDGYRPGKNGLITIKEYCKEQGFKIVLSKYNHYERDDELDINNHSNEYDEEDEEDEDNEYLNEDEEEEEDEEFDDTSTTMAETNKIKNKTSTNVQSEDSAYPVEDSQHQAETNKTSVVVKEDAVEKRITRETENEDNDQKTTTHTMDDHTQG